MTPFTLTIQKLQDTPGKTPVTLLNFEGELDGTNVEEQSSKIYRLIEDGGKHMTLVFNLRDLHYMNSKAIGFMTDWSAKINAKGGHIILADVPANIKDLLSTIGIFNLFKEYDTVENAKKQIYKKHG